MDINRANLETILADVAVHYKHACDKHPYFADRFYTPIAGEPPTDCLLAGARAALEGAIREGCVDVFMVLNCETCEIAEAYARGNMEQAREECLDAIAVLMRMVDVIDGLQQLGNPDAPKKQITDRRCGTLDCHCNDSRGVCLRVGGVCDHPTPVNL